MTPKSKAKELIYLFEFNFKECDNAKTSALILVDEMIEENRILSLEFKNVIKYKNYWEAVKEEIEKL